jgi:hypothetical protein
MADCRQAGESAIEQLARRAPLQVGDEADTARAALVPRVVEELLLAHWAAPSVAGEDVSRLVFLS